MNSQEKFQRFVAKHPHSHTAFYNRPHLSRRRFFQMLGGGVSASLLGHRLALAGETTAAAPVTTLNKAKNIIFILLSGAPSHIDTFDFKFVEGVTPTTFAPDRIKGIDWPTGLLPKLGTSFNSDEFAIVRSVKPWALVHSLAQTWTQIGRNPAAALGDIAPNMGSVVALRKDVERLPGQVFPTFLALNSNTAEGPGFLPAANAPFKHNVGFNQPTRGLPNTTHGGSSSAARTNFDNRWNLMHQLDDPLRVVDGDSALGRPVEDYDQFYNAARGLMYNASVDAAFKFEAEDAARYGSSNFGAACLVAKQVLQANQGTRYIQISQGGWDMHTGIYATNALPALGKVLDDGVSALLADLKSSGLLNETLVVMMGEFGRTVGQLSAAAGRDHYLQQFAFFAGAGVLGGRTLGSTTSDGSRTENPGWSRNRDIRIEDIEATMYSALGINWTELITDPTGRGFEMVPFSDQDIYGPINELWV